MSDGAKAVAVFVGFAIGWDLVCCDGETLSEALARGLADRRTRWPLVALIAALLAHLAVLARSDTEPPDGGEPVGLEPPPKPIPLELFTPLRNLGWPA